MVTFKSDSYSISATASALAEFLGNPSNLKLILPEDRIENWKEKENGCSFKIKGLAEIHLKVEDSSEEKVVFRSDSDKPFAFKLIVHFAQNDQTSTELSANFDADVNSFMSMMLKTPLTNFLNALGEAIKKHFA
ncbi:MAG: hypothetical protein WEC59_03020 [Salibacteraceae bacterium]